VIAAWIGLVALGLWRRGASTAAVGVCVLSGLVGWLFRPEVGVLDTEHLVALGLGIALAASVGAGAAASGAGAASSAGRASWRRRSRAAESPA
jgi:hypothetical protein